MTQSKYATIASTGLILALAGGSALGGTVVEGSADDFTVYREFSFLGTANDFAVNGDGSTLQARWEDNAALEQRNRPVYQFNLEGLNSEIFSATIELTTFSVEQNSLSPNASFDVDLFGLDETKSSSTSPASVTDPTATALYDDPEWFQLNGENDPFAEGDVGDNTVVSLDVTDFIQERLDEMELTPGDSWAYFQLRADAPSSGEDFRFYSADATDPDSRPRLVIDQVPTPGTLAALGLMGLAGTRRRR